MVLQTLTTMGPLHGYGIARRIEEVSGDEVLLNQGTIYASLVRLQQRGWIPPSGAPPTTTARRSTSHHPQPAASSGKRHRLLASPPAVMGRVLAMQSEGDLKWALSAKPFNRVLVLLPQAAARHRPRRRDGKATSTLAIEENISHGMSPEEARRHALIRFGGVQQAERAPTRSPRPPLALDILLQDLRYASRTLRRDSGFATIAILILALGIGANIVVFSVVNTILLRPLPFPEANRLVRLAPKVSKCGASCATYSTDAVQEFQRRTNTFSDLTGYDAFTAPGNWKLNRRRHSQAHLPDRGHG